MKRDIIKTGTYSITHFVVAFTVAFLLTQNVAIALSIGMIEPAVQTFAYFVHEQLWKKSETI
jgi:uncharacterized membrane protein